VQDVSFRIERGEVFALLGPNRAGKTTLVKMLLALCRPTSGSGSRLGLPFDDRDTLSRVGYVHENQAFPKYLTASVLLNYYGALTFMPSKELEERVPKLLERVGLSDRSREPISSFSKGMVQRLALAQALLNEPDLLVLDEPMEGLDIEGRAMVYEIIAEQRRQSRTVLLVTHILNDIEALCDRTAVLNRGRLAYHGPVADLLKNPKTGEPRPLKQALEAFFAKEQP
jgi:ABC-2 type transport system ATP-binding protein